MKAWFARQIEPRFYQIMETSYSPHHRDSTLDQRESPPNTKFLQVMANGYCICNFISHIMHDNTIIVGNGKLGRFLQKSLLSSIQNQMSIDIKI